MKNTAVQNRGMFRIGNLHFTPARLILSVILLTVLVLVILLTAFILFYKPAPPDDITDKYPGIGGGGDGLNLPDDPDGIGFPPSGDRVEGVYHFLFAGFDPQDFNTDSLMVISFNATDDKVTILQIPRDTYIDTKDSSKKINSAYAYGLSEARSKGIASADRQDYAMIYLANAVQRNFGIKIDYYILMNTEGLVNIVNILGGIEVDVSRRMLYSDPAQNLYIDLQPGLQTLNGKQAEGFVRYRSGYADADFGRMNAQKQFMTAFFKKIKSGYTLAKIPDLIGQVNTYFSASMKLEDSIFFAKEVFGVDIGSIEMFTVPSDGIYVGRAAYVGVKVDEMIKLVNEYMNPFKDFAITRDTVKVPDLSDLKAMSPPQSSGSNNSNNNNNSQPPSVKDPEDGPTENDPPEPPDAAGRARTVTATIMKTNQDFADFM